MYSVTSGNVKYVSDKNTHQDAAEEIIEHTHDGCMLGTDIRVVDMYTGTIEHFDTQDILNELNFEWED